MNKIHYIKIKRSDVFKMTDIADQEFTPMVPFMPKNPKYYHAYVPYQINFKVVSPNEGIKMGTMFPDLYSPWKERPLW